MNCNGKASLCIICQLNTVVIHNFNFKSFAEIHAKAFEMLVAFGRFLMDLNKVLPVVRNIYWYR
jgi:hypothetical protein